MREPHDVFIREFLQHPAWEEVIEKLESLALGLKERVIAGTKDNFDENRGRVEGVYEAISLLHGLIKQSQVRG